MLDTGYRIQDTGYRIQDTGYRIKEDKGYKVKSGFQNLQFKNKRMEMQN